MLDDMVADGVRPDLFSYSTALACVSRPLEWISWNAYVQVGNFVRVGEMKGK